MEFGAVFFPVVSAVGGGTLFTARVDAHGVSMNEGVPMVRNRPYPGERRYDYPDEYWSEDDE